MIPIKINSRRKKQTGFTLLEILVALFIFTILSFILSRALRTVIDTQAATEQRATQLRDLQIALLVFSKDVAQTVNRPILAANGSELVAFEGGAREFSFTHAGFANLGQVLTHSNLQRANYTIHDNGLWRNTWTALDQAPDSSPNSRELLSKITTGSFQYLSKNGKFYSKWPTDEANDEILPRAIKLNLSILGWGNMSQLYLIPAQTNSNNAPSTAEKSNATTSW